MLAVGWYSAKRGTGVVAKYVDARLGKPSLVRETSRLTPFELLKHPVVSARQLMRKADDPLKGIVLNVSCRENYVECENSGGGSRPVTRKKFLEGAREKNEKKNF